MIYTFVNAGIEEQVSFSGKAVEEILLPLLRDLTALQQKEGRRILVFLAAPPGAGKSTLADFLQYLSCRTPGVRKITVIGMDGFHRYQDYLMTHTTEREGREIPLVKIKGAPITFDLPLLSERVRMLKTDDAVNWPAYDRKLHNPVEDAVRVTGDIVLIEGNYLLLEDEGWRDLRQYADYTIKLTAGDGLLRERLVSRKISTGVSRPDAEVFVDFSDMYNVNTCTERNGNADLVIRVEELIGDE